MTVYWKQWFSLRKDADDIEQRIKQIINAYPVEPHIYYINGPPLTGKKTFGHLMKNILSKYVNGESPSVAVVMPDEDFTYESPTIHTYFIICGPLLEIPSINMGHSIMPFIRQYSFSRHGVYGINTPNCTEQIQRDIRRDIRRDIGLESYTPLSRQSSCGSSIDSPISPIYDKPVFVK